MSQREMKDQTQDIVGPQPIKAVFFFSTSSLVLFLARRK
jgi:hypothetical protein